LYMLKHFPADKEVLMAEIKRRELEQKKMVPPEMNEAFRKPVVPVGRACSSSRARTLKDILPPLKVPEAFQQRSWRHKASGHAPQTPEATSRATTATSLDLSCTDQEAGDGPTVRCKSIPLRCRTIEFPAPPSSEIMDEVTPWRNKRCMTLPPSAQQLQILSVPNMTGECAFEASSQPSSSEDQANDECSQQCSDTESGAKVQPERLPSAGKAKEAFSLQAIEAFLCQRPGTCANDPSNEQKVITSAEDMSKPAETDMKPRMAHTLNCLPDDEHQSNKSAKETSSTRSARRQTSPRSGPVEASCPHQTATFIF